MEGAPLVFVGIAKFHFNSNTHLFCMPSYYIKMISILVVTHLFVTCMHIRSLLCNFYIAIEPLNYYAFAFCYE